MGIECDFTRHPILEPSHLFAGNPPKELRHKFLLASESVCEPLTADKLPSGMEILSLPGHSFDMVGFLVDDGTAFLADALSSEETLAKYGVGYIYDVGAYLDTLESIKQVKTRVFIPSHAAPTADIVPLAEYNIKKVCEVADRIVEICESPVAFDTLLQRLFKAYGLQMSFQQYALVGSTVRSYLVWLTEKGRIASRIEDEMLLWESVK
jgi:glyoxylase-like metal-dependent hydrolase (beta-lactamase superfamily II)